MVIFETEAKEIKNMIKKEEETMNSIVAATGMIPLITSTFNEFNSTILMSLEEIMSTTKNHKTPFETDQKNLIKFLPFKSCKCSLIFISYLNLSTK
jgi:hypothetical protein